MDKIELSDCKPKNNKFMGKKVLYGEADKLDPKDKSNEYLEVVAVEVKHEKNPYATANSVLNEIVDAKEVLEVGDLVSINIQHQVEKRINKEFYYMATVSSIDFVIKKSDVKESLLK